MLHTDEYLSPEMPVEHHSASMAPYVSKCSCASCDTEQRSECREVKLPSGAPVLFRAYKRPSARNRTNSPRFRWLSLTSIAARENMDPVKVVNHLFSESISVRNRREKDKFVQVGLIETVMFIT